jgi:mono/diheme cytochrome c family protein
MPGVARVSGTGRVDVRLAVDNDGELYLLTKTDGLIRKIVGVSGLSTASTGAANSTPAANLTAANPGGGGQGAGARTNPVASTPESLATGKRIYDSNCAGCHGNVAQGAVKAGTIISIIEEQNGRQPPDLTDDRWDHGSSDGEIFTVVKKGLPPTMMPGFDGGIADNDIWNIVNYLRSLRPQK